MSFPVRELLSEIDRKIDTIDDKLDKKAERDRVHDLATRVATLELTSVKREGPVMQEIRDYEKRLEYIASQLQRFENGVGDRIQNAIREANDNAQKAADRSFSRREKMIGGVCLIVGAMGTVVSMIVLILQVGS